jgi:hypothetical protein
MDQERLEELTAGLLFMSESDAPLDYYQLDEAAARRWPPATPAQFLELIGEALATPIEEIVPEMFFEELIQGNEEDQVVVLQTAITDELENLKCYRVGRIEIRIYLLGQNRSKQVIGLKTLSVET